MVEKSNVASPFEIIAVAPTPEEKKPPAATNAFVSILVPCTGMIEYTELCVASILRYTRQPYELIFIDIGSLDGTAQFLSGIKTASPMRVEIIRAPADLAMSDACKESLAAARGEYIVLLANDTILTKSWLQRMISLASASDVIGMVGPMSNYAPSSQLVENVPYRIKPKRSKNSARDGQRELLIDVNAVQSFAAELAENNKGKWGPVDALAGFCLLLKRQVLDRIAIGNIAASTDLGVFDTRVLNIQARAAGYTLGCCRDVYVHNFGTIAFSHGGPFETHVASNQ